MPTDAQINANRANAARSTGPRTEDGKARASRNALRHGGYSLTYGADSAALLSDENRASFHALRETYVAQYQPVTETERFLVARMTLAAWRLNRLAALEGRVVADHREAAVHNRDWAQTISAVFREALLDDPSVEAPGAPEPPARDPVARAYVRDSERGNTITKLARYQILLERSYYRAFDKLERLRRPPKPAKLAS